MPFDSERQALALMDHPHIARVFDAGASDRGRPYFVMEYVDGIPITEYCDRHRLNNRERIELFIAVCQAVHHAHQKGIIHRDIKPSNVLVSEQDGKPFPKVIDFGIAKAIDHQAMEQATFTQMGSLVGTPEYMSPEQTLLTANIDTTTDVYSLGVLLYELLAGALPFEGKRLREAGLEELLRIIREEDPPTPSEKVSTLEDTAGVAERRRTNPALLRRQLTGDLNWIVMKALEKERLRRYASVSELAADIRRHLENHAVLAGPPSKLYRARKFVQRHRLAVSAGVLIAASLIAGAAVATVERNRAVAERQRADTEAATARAVNDFLQNDLLSQLGALNDMAQLYALQGKPAQAEPLYAKVVEGARRVLGAEHMHTLIGMSNLAMVYRDEHKYTQAEPLCIQVLGGLQRVLGEEHPNTLGSMSNLAVVYREERKYAQSEALLVTVLDARRRVLGEENLDTLNTMNELAFLYLYQGRYAQAEASVREALIGHQKRKTTTWHLYSTQSLLGASLAGQKKYEEAESLAVSGYEGMLRLENTIPAGRRFKLEQAGTWIVQLYRDWGKPEKAAVWTQKLKDAGLPVSPKKKP